MKFPLKLAPVRLGMHIAFRRVRRKTAPTILGAIVDGTRRVPTTLLCLKRAPCRREFTRNVHSQNVLRVHDRHNLSLR